MIYKYLEKNWHKKKFKRNQGGHCPVIFPNLTNYYRQYYGTIESNDHKIINIICFWKSKEEDHGWKSYLVIVNGGCSYYWEIKIDMDKKKCYDFYVNGPD